MGTTQQKFEYSFEAKDLIKQGINNLGGNITSQTELKEYADELQNIYDVLPKTSYQEGTEVNLSNTLKGKLDFDDGKVGFGQASQDTTQGYNLIDVTSGTIVTDVVTGVTASMSGDVITLNGTRGDGNTDPKRFIDNLNKFGTLTSGRTYRMSLNNISGTFNGGIAITFRDASGQIEYIQTSNGGTSATRELTFSRSVTYIRIVVTGSFTASNFKFQLMLQDTTEEKPFEPYTGGYSSPSPNWEQEIKCVAGRNKLKVDFEAVSVNGIDFSSSEEEITITGTTTASANTIVGQITLPKGSYTLSCTNMAYAWGTSRIEVSGTGIDTLSFFSGTLVRQLTLSQETALTFRAIVSGVGTSVNYKTKIQVEEGSVAHNWLPYNTIEEVVSGKNLINVPETIISARSALFEAQNITSGNYSLSITKSRVSGVTIGNQYLHMCKEIKFYDSSDTLLTTTSVNMTPSVTDTPVTKVVNFTAPANTSYITIEFSNNNGDNNLNTLLSNVMLVSGTYNESTIPTYEPYITPKTYQFSLGDHKFYGIGTYRDYILRTTGKNLFDIADCRNNYTLGSDGIPTYNSAQTRIANMTPIIVEGMEKVTMTFTNYHNGAFMYSLLRADNTLITRTINCYSGTTITIGEAKYMYICFYDNATTENVKDAMLVEGSTALDYQPYGVGNWYKVGKIGEVTLNGTQTIDSIDTVSANTTRVSYFNIISNNPALGYSDTRPTLSNYFISKNVWSSDELGLYTNANAIVFRVPKTIGTTSEAINTWLQTHNVLACYMAQNTTYTPITGTLAEQLEAWWNGQSLDGTTIIEGNGDLPMIIKVRGLKGA